MSEPQMPDAYPLNWPKGVPRTPKEDRRPARFNHHGQRLTVGNALRRLEREVTLLGGYYRRVSSDLRVRQDGWPMSKQRVPDDPGIAVYFVLDERPICLPCDKWDRIADNIGAVAAHIDAMRRIQRYGVGTTEQAFRGYTAQLYAVDGSDWKTVLENPTTKAEAKQTFLRLAKSAHPDAGGDEATMSRLNVAHRRAQTELK